MLNKSILIFSSTLLAIAIVAFSQESNPEKEIEVWKAALGRSRQSNLTCENDAANLTAQYNSLAKDYAAKVKEFNDMQRDYENIKKQLEEKSNAPEERQK